MSTIFHLVRHASHSTVGTTLIGRAPGVCLSDSGRAEAERLGAHFASLPVMGVISSPRERAQETAEPIARALQLQPKTSAALDEVDFGAWQGKEFSELAAEPLWNQWNVARSVTRAPGGEAIIEVQTRIIAEVMALRNAWPDRQFVLVSHAEPIRVMLLYALGLHLDAWARIEISPASISNVAIDGWGARVVSLNEMPCTQRVVT